MCCRFIQWLFGKDNFADQPIRQLDIVGNKPLYLAVLRKYDRESELQPLPGVVKSQFLNFKTGKLQYEFTLDCLTLTKPEVSELYVIETFLFRKIL